MKKRTGHFVLSGLMIGLALVVTICFGETKPDAKTITDKIKLPDSTVEFTLVKLPAGKIAMKDKDGKEKEYEIKPIWMGRTEVTWDEYDVFWQFQDVPRKDMTAVRTKALKEKSRPSAPYSPPDRGWGHDGFPAGSMLYLCAKAYCVWLSENTGHKYRLPTEAEWEYACRAGGPAVKLEKAELEKVAWYEGNSEDQTHHVAKKAPNEWGLYDMLGNMAEWVSGNDGVPLVAGGSFEDAAADVHSGARSAYDPRWQRNDPAIPKGLWMSNGGHVGFRVVRED